MASSCSAAASLEGFAALLSGTPVANAVRIGTAPVLMTAEILSIACTPNPTFRVCCCTFIEVPTIMRLGMRIRGLYLV